MLKNRYDEILIGLNVGALLKGLISLKNNKSVLLIDDKRFSGKSFSADFVSELEVFGFLRVAKHFDIAELGDIKKFLRPGVIDLNTDKVRLRTGALPFDNLRELLRKYPELINKSDLDLVYQEGEKQFNQIFLDELKRYESILYENSLRGKSQKFEFSANLPKWFKGIFQKFSELMSFEYSHSQTMKFKALLHVMSVTFEEKMKSRLTQEEMYYYFFKLLCPVYRLQDFILIAQLKRRLMILGGDFKESKIQYWQFYQGRFENLLLASFEGVISAGKVYFFTTLPEDLPFKLTSPYPFYRSVQMHVDKSSVTSYPAHHLVVMANESSLGTQRPYRIVTMDEAFSSYYMPYFHMPASKPDFYLAEISDLFSKDAKTIPFSVVGPHFEDVLSSTVDLRLLNKAPTDLARDLLPLTLEHEEGEVGGFEYWGAHKYYGLGQLGLMYGIMKN